MMKIVIYMVSVCLMGMSVITVRAQDLASDTGKGALASDVKNQASETAETTGQFLHQKKRTISEEGRGTTSPYEKKIGDLAIEAEDKGEKAEKEAAEKSYEMAGKLKEKGMALRIKLLDDLKAAGSEKWDSFKKEFDAMLKDLGNMYAHAVAKVRAGDSAD